MSVPPVPLGDDAIGRQIRVIWMSPGQRVEREVVGKFLGNNFRFDPEGAMDIDLRPQAGTCRINYKWVRRMYYTSEDTLLPRTHRRGRDVRIY